MSRKLDMFPTHYKKLTENQFLDLFTVEGQRMMGTLDKKELERYYGPHRMGDRVFLDPKPLRRVPAHVRMIQACCNGPMYPAIDDYGPTMVCSHVVESLPNK